MGVSGVLVAAAAVTVVTLAQHAAACVFNRARPLAPTTALFRFTLLLNPLETLFRLATGALPTPALRVWWKADATQRQDWFLKARQGGRAPSRPVGWRRSAAPPALTRAVALAVAGVSSAAAGAAGRVYRGRGALRHHHHRHAAQGAPKPSCPGPSCGVDALCVGLLLLTFPPRGGRNLTQVKS
jgi:hypothetical protein